MNRWINVSVVSAWVSVYAWPWIDLALHILGIQHGH